MPGSRSLINVQEDRTKFGSLIRLIDAMVMVCDDVEAGKFKGGKLFKLPLLWLELLAPLNMSLMPPNKPFGRTLLKGGLQNGKFMVIINYAEESYFQQHLHV